MSCMTESLIPESVEENIYTGNPQLYSAAVPGFYWFPVGVPLALSRSI